MTDVPQSPADPRPNGEPYFIDSECPECGEDLVLYDSLDEEQMRLSEVLADPDVAPERKEVWHDEFVCPECLDGVHMDWPEEHKDGVFGRIEDIDEEDFASLDDLEEALEDE